MKTKLYFILKEIIKLIRGRKTTTYVYIKAMNESLKAVVLKEDKVNNRYFIVYTLSALVKMGPYLLPAWIPMNSHLIEKIEIH